MGNSLPVPNDRMLKLIETAKLTRREQKKLWKCFKKVDRDRSGTVDAVEFFQFIGVPKTDFSDGLFDLIDTDSSRELDFFEFASALVTFGCFTEEEMLKYCFFIFDKDKNGFIEMEELDYLLECLHQGDFQTSIATVLEQIDTDGDGRISMDEFVAINNKFPLLLFPAFRFQKAIMAATFDERFWTRKRETLAAAKKKREQRQNKLRQRKRFDVVVERTKKLHVEVGPLGVMWHALESLVRHGTGMGTAPQAAPPLCDGANFVPVPTALANKVLFANGDPEERGRRRRGGGDESPGAASRRVAQDHAEDRRGRSRNRSIKRQKRKAAAVVPEKPKPKPKPKLAPAPAPEERMLLPKPAAVAAPPPGRGRRWSQEALALAAPAPEA